jgi:hypothetical protein
VCSSDLFDPTFWDKPLWRVYTIASFVVSSVGFVWIAVALAMHALA